MDRQANKLQPHLYHAICSLWQGEALLLVPAANVNPQLLFCSQLQRSSSAQSLRYFLQATPYICSFTPPTASRSPPSFFQVSLVASLALGYPCRSTHSSGAHPHLSGPNLPPSSSTSSPPKPANGAPLPSTFTSHPPSPAYCSTLCCSSYFPSPSRCPSSDARPLTSLPQTSSTSPFTASSPTKNGALSSTQSLHSPPSPQQVPPGSGSEEGRTSSTASWL